MTSSYLCSVSQCVFVTNYTKINIRSGFKSMYQTYIVFNVANGLRLGNWLHQKGSFLVVVIGISISVGFSLRVWSGLCDYQD